jgi:hypothetical protein
MWPFYDGAIQEEWDKITSEEINKAISTMPA